MTKPTKRRRIECRPTPCGIGEAMELLRAARARGLVSEEQLDLSLKLLLRRHGLVPATVTT
jgi:hypothetical protein